MTANPRDSERLAEARAIASRWVNAGYGLSSAEQKREVCAEEIAAALASRDTALAEKERELREAREAEHRLSDAYLRLRSIIPGSYKTPDAPTPEQVWETTEAAATRLFYESKNAAANARKNEVIAITLKRERDATLAEAVPLRKEIEALRELLGAQKLEAEAARAECERLRQRGNKAINRLARCLGVNGITENHTDALDCISDDGELIFIDGPGDVPIDDFIERALPRPTPTTSGGSPVLRDWCEEHNRGELPDGLCPECEERSAKWRAERLGVLKPHGEGENPSKSAKHPSRCEAGTASPPAPADLVERAREILRRFEAGEGQDGENWGPEKLAQDIANEFRERCRDKDLQDLANTLDDAIAAHDAAHGRAQGE